MLAVLFQLDGDRYAVDARFVVEIVPLTDLKAVPHAPEYVAGMFAYHETAAPVLDLCRLMKGRACRPLLSSRIMLLDYGRLCGESGGKPRVLGLLAEGVTEVRERARAAVPSPVTVPGAPYLGGVFFHDGGIGQNLEPAALLPASLREMLFAGSEQAARDGGGAA